MIIQRWECLAPPHLDRCTDEQRYHIPANRKRASNSYFCGMRTESIRCDGKGCTEEVDLRKYSIIRASSYYGWMIKQDDSEAWCWKHLPQWVIPWRDTHRPGWRQKLSKKLLRELEAKEAGRGKYPMTIDQRIEARHILQVMFERCRAARNAMEPQTGVPTITVERFEEQVRQLVDPLEEFLARVQTGASSHPYNTGDRSA